MSSYFISYSSADRPTAARLADDLREAGIHIWFDQTDIQPSERWDRAVEAGLRQAAGVLLVMSPRSIASENVLDEISLTMDAGKPIVPLMIEACQPPLRLARVQYIDATRDYSAALARCKAVIAAHQGSPSVTLPAASARPANLISAEVQERLSQRLIHHLGPVARHVVERESLSAKDGADLIARLGERIPDPKERQAFCSQARKDL